MISRSKRLVLTATLAAGFVLLRVVYAFVFSGLDGKDLLLQVPEVRLSGPLRHISFFGDVALDGILRNIQLSLPFALMILVFGTLASFITPKMVAKIAQNARTFKKLLTALAISLAGIPGLIHSAKEMALAARLRGEKTASIFIPLLERTVVAAGEIGLALARSEPQPFVSRDLVLSHFKVDQIGPWSVTFQRGSINVITGETGSGKSTLLQFIAGQLAEHYGRRPSGSVTYGEFDFNDFSQASGRVAFVKQFPKLGTFHEEILLRNESRKAWQLSHGESYLAYLDAELARDPSVILLDEPAGALDNEALSEVLARCEVLAQQGRVVIIAEHRISSFSGLNASYWRIDEGRLLPGMKFATNPPPVRKPALVGKEVSVEISDISVGHDSILLEDVNLQVHQGEAIAITGGNGSGKTSLLNQLATSSKGMWIHGVLFQGPNPTRIALIPEDVSSFFVTATLKDELKRSDKVAKVPNGFTLTTMESLIPVSSAQLDTHPLDLSAGTQLALATAMQLSHKPQLLLLDEPVQGLDAIARAQLAETIRCVQETGCAVIFATHDHFFAQSLAERVYTIEDKKLKSLAEVSQ